MIVGIILWAVGAAQCNPEMILAGKILFGISFLPLAIAVVAGCCLGACAICFTAGGERNFRAFFD